MNSISPRLHRLRQSRARGCCVYRWSHSRPAAPHHGAAIKVACVNEGRLASGNVTLLDEERRVACEMAMKREAGASP